jgi:heptosyltransferase-2
MKSKQKVLIIKSGYSEFLLNKDSDKPSLGDILRITPILHLFKNDYVVWLTDKSAIPLLEGNKYIDKVLPLDFSTTIDLLEEDFDIVINLEKNNNLCKLSNKINAWKRYGFRYDKNKNKAEAYDRASEVLAYGADINIKKKSKKLAQELLFELVGEKWKGEEYILGYKPKSKEIFDIGLNTRVGGKFPFKAWPDKNWDELEQLLIKKGFKVTRQDKQSQDVLSNLYNYMDWINSCKVIVTNDSLGLHLAIAMKKKIIGLFGPTKHEEVYFYNRGKAILPYPNLKCIPCLSEEGKCTSGDYCMKKILPKKVYAETIKEIRK